MASHIKLLYLRNHTSALGLGLITFLWAYFRNWSISSDWEVFGSMLKYSSAQNHGMKICYFSAAKHRFLVSYLS